MPQLDELLGVGQGPSSDILSRSGLGSAVTSVARFEALLKPRTAVPSQRYARFLTMDDESLAAAAVTTRHAAEHLRRVLEDLRGRPARVDVVLGGMALDFFSEDHGWRDIFQALLADGQRFTAHKLLAVADYRRYLLNCLDALNRVSTDRLQSTLCSEAMAQEEERTAFAAKGAAAQEPEARAVATVRDLVRLPRGRTLRLRPGREGSLELWLATRRFRVETWSGAALVDEQGSGVRLQEGRNLVGRGLYNDVVVDAAFTDVSRRHLILDLEDGLPAAVTDLSSAGTCLPRSRLPSTPGNGK